MSVCFEKYELKNRNLNNKHFPGIYLCELARTISVVNLNESQIYPKFEYAYLLHKGESLDKPLASYKNDATNLARHLNNGKKCDNLFNSQIHLSAVDFSDAMKKLLFYRHIHVPKNFETIEKIVFVVKTGSQICSQHKAELVRPNYYIKDHDRVTKSMLVNSSHNVILKDENLTVETLIFFENKFQEVFRLDSSKFDFKDIFERANVENERNSKDLKSLTFQNRVGSLGKSNSTNIYQAVIYRKKVSFSEFVEINTKDFHQSTIQNNEIETFLKESSETSQLQISGYPKKPSDTEDNEELRNESTISSLLKEQPTHDDLSGSSSDYATCSSIRLKRTNNPPFISRTSSLKVGNDKSRRSENLNIPIERRDKISSVSIFTNRKKLLYKSKNSEMMSLRCSISSMSKDMPNIKKITDDIQIQKSLIDNLLEPTINLFVENIKQIKHYAPASNENNQRSQQIFDIMYFTWEGVKDLSICLFDVGSSLFNCSASSITRAIFHFYYNGYISYLT